MKLIKVLLSIKVRVKTALKTRMFLRNAIVGENTKFDSMSYCINRAGEKRHILIGKNGLIRGGLIVEGDGTITIGDRTYIGGDTMIGACSSVVIGSDVIIAGNCRIYDNNNHPTAPQDRLEMTRSGDFFGPLWKWNDKVERKPVVIEDNVWIGEHCSVLKGVTIGKGSVVGCRSVVTKDVPAYCVVAGNPARVVKKLPIPED